jgi:hypothetical protein
VRTLPESARGGGSSDGAAYFPPGRMRHYRDVSLHELIAAQVNSLFISCNSYRLFFSSSLYLSFARAQTFPVSVSCIYFKLFFPSN